MVYFFEYWKDSVEECIGVKGLLASIAFIIIIENILNLLFLLKHVCLTYVMPQAWPSTNFVGKYGKWAVITGCTNGIGYAYANELAARGMDIVLVSRNPSKLQDCAKSLEERHGMNDLHRMLTAITHP